MADKRRLESYREYGRHVDRGALKLQEKRFSKMTDTENAKRKQSRTRGLRPWKEGQSGNPAGRPKGMRNKFTEAFWVDFFGAWEKHGTAALEKTAANDPAIFVRCAASLMPKELKVEHDLSNMTDEQIAKRIRELDAAIVAELGNASRATEVDGRATPPSTKH
jgi:Family of unknown function (DUF5681)